jgi:hypothetical protein
MTQQNPQPSENNPKPSKNSQPDVQPRSKDGTDVETTMPPNPRKPPSRPSRTSRHNSGVQKKRRFLLSLDGGGIRGLAGLAILDKMMRQIDPNNPPKPCEVFDMIGGTSTGGLVALYSFPEQLNADCIYSLIAIMLGPLEMSVDDCITAYRSLSQQAFTLKPGIVFPLKFKWDFFSLSVKTQNKYDAKALERVVKDLVKQRLGDEDAILLQKDPKCYV